MIKNLGGVAALRDQPAACLLALYLLGNLCLPIADFSGLAQDPMAFVGVLGNALPYGPWVNRAVLLGPLVLVLAAIDCLAARRQVALHWLDGTLLLWLLAPALTGLANDSPIADDLLQSLYLAVVWGAPYAAMRLAYRRAEDLHACLTVLAGCGLISFGIALTEFVLGRFWYELLYAFHPYQEEGPQRYFGFRPLLMFEDANQIGMWWASVAVAALALLWSPVRSRVPAWCLGAVALTPFLFQAIGGSLLTLLGAALLRIPGRRTLGAILLVCLAAGLVGMAFRGPLLRYGRQWTQTTAAGQAVKSILRDSSIGSFGWRLGLEEKNSGLLRPRWVFGWGSVNYWRVDDASERPWGLITLVTGAYGAVGCGLWCALTLAPCAVFFFQGMRRPWPERIPLQGMIVILLINFVDASLNSAYLLPCMLCLGLVNSVDRTSQGLSR